MDNNDMYQNEQTTGTEPENNQFTDNSNNNNEYQNNYTGNDYTGNSYNGNNYNGNNYTGNNNSGNNYNSNNYNSNYQQYTPYGNYNGNYQVPNQQDSLLDLEEPMKVSEWLITFLIMMIPCVNIVMVFVWAFGSTEKKSKSNYFKAELIFMGIILAFYLVFIMVIAALGFAAFAR